LNQEGFFNNFACLEQMYDISIPANALGIESARQAGACFSQALQPDSDRISAN
jgi:hypothetical protein